MKTDHAVCSACEEDMKRRGGAIDETAPACPVCGGSGSVVKTDPARGFADAAAACSEFFEDLAVLNRFGAEYLRASVGEFSPVFIEAVLVFEAEMKRLGEAGAGSGVGSGVGAGAKKGA